MEMISAYEQLDRLRREKKVTKKKLCQVAGVTVQAGFAWQTGTPIPYDKLAVMMAYLGYKLVPVPTEDGELLIEEFNRRKKKSKNKSSRKLGQFV